MQELREIQRSTFALLVEGTTGLTCLKLITWPSEKHIGVHDYAEAENADWLHLLKHATGPVEQHPAMMIFTEDLFEMGDPCDSIISFQNTASRERRRNRLRAPFGDEDIPIVFAGSGGREHFHRRLSANHGTGFFYDERMLLHKNEWFPSCPECPEHSSIILNRCELYGRLSRCALITAEPASDELLFPTHRHSHVSKVTETESMLDDERKTLASELDSAFFNELLYFRLRTGFFYDERMLLHKNEWFPSCPECPEHSSIILNRCELYGRLSRCALITAEPASDELLFPTHRHSHVSKVTETESMLDDERKTLASELDSAFFNEVSNWTCACFHTDDGVTYTSYCCMQYTLLIESMQAASGL
ncbi:hypothetical protein EG68_07487 [Paragonimus skrjabini miyazakii]|uniref:Uncharacterized protein n=1 Tax=Paragonimus skrjabini miyazakii TaxID=59628 RepID=A0A8S9YMX6_9TREM|nr:hypothetical protein EG68_07487 [Paragonimus skrjabini miyazakii]